ncbi:MAG TPA: helix-turn-helix transcriptional regulator [Casimicrobiaceae bacterium]|nr:helix-turn-helix transcriptional regulator [Casimicrobiaceae bacterium]
MIETPLRRLRISRGISQAEVGAAIGTDQGYVSRVERGEQGISPEMAARIVTFFGRDEITEMQILYPERYVAAVHSAASGD